MRVDYEYLKLILDVFLESERPTVDWESFRSFHEVSEDKFVFHIEICADKDLIMGALKDRSIGISRGHNEYYVSVIPWRLSASGHDFAAALNKPSIMGVIKERFQTEGLSAVIDIAKKLVENQAERLIGNIA
ncbi:hypothetical protein [Pseudomonas mohnii]